MKKMKQNNNGFSLVELIIALAVLAFLMLAISSFMGSSVMQNKKVNSDVKIQSQAQETYSLITDSIMQASDLLIVGYTVSDSSLVDFSKTGEETTAVLTKKYFVRDKATAEALVNDPSAYGISESVSKADVIYFKDAKDEPIYIEYMRVESALPIDMTFVPGGNSNILASQTIMNSLTGDAVEIDCVEQNSKKIYSVNDTLVSYFYFDKNNMYYGRQYAFMTDLDDKVDMNDSDSRLKHLYNQYFAYNVGKNVATNAGLSGCVASINATDGTIGIDLYYNRSDMSYTTVGRINPRNSYVLVPKN